MRQPRDPRSYDSMDALRAELHRQGRQQGPSLSSLLNHVGDRSFGYRSAAPQQGMHQMSSHLVDRIARALAVSLLGPVGLLAGLFRSLVGKSIVGRDASCSEAALPPEAQEAVAQLAVLLTCSERCAARLALRCPQVPGACQTGAGPLVGGAAEHSSYAGPKAAVVHQHAISAWLSEQHSCGSALPDLKGGVTAL